VENFLTPQCKNLSTIFFHPSTPSVAVRKQKIFILDDLFHSVLSKLKKYHPSGNLKFNNLGIFPSLKLRILMGKIPPIPLKLNFTPNDLGYYGLNTELTGVIF